MRPHVMRSYIDNIVTYLTLSFPHIPPKQIEKIVQDEVESQCTQMQTNLDTALRNQEDVSEIIPRAPKDRLWPTVRVIHYSNPDTQTFDHSYGNMTVVSTEDLLDHICDISDKIIAPFGSSYETVDHISSFLKGMIDEKSALRKKEKKLMLKARQNNDKVAATFHNNNQSTIKVSMNSLIGAMGSNFNFLSSVANFNSVTSTGRYFVTNAFAHGERFLHANFFFMNEEELINHIVTCKRFGPDKEHVLEVCRQKGFKIPTADEVYKFLVSNLHKYQFAKPHHEIQYLIQQLHPGELTFLYYMSNMKHLVFENEWYFRPWLDQFISGTGIDFGNVENIDPQELYALDSDLVIVLSTVYNHEMPVNEKGNSISIYDTVTMYPDLAKKFVCIGKFMQARMDGIQDVFDLFMNHNVAITYIHELKHMFRDVIMLSDTDSILFTVKDWIEWYQKSLKFTRESFSLNAIVVYWLSKSIRTLIMNSSAAFGAIGADVKKMNMKNEFMMPIEIMTSLKKHYASILAIQEGVFYKTPKLDIKGVNLRGSNFSQETLNYIEWWIQNIINEIYQTGAISIKEKIVEVLRFERVIYDSLRNHEVRFLTVDPIKSENEYKEADRTVYFNYLFWEYVFGDKYGHILIPTKCYILPLTNINHQAYKALLADKYPDIERRIQEFMNKYPGKEITRIPINPLTNVIPEELLPITHYKSIVYANVKPFYLILNSLGISLGNDNNKILLSDLYGWVDEDEAAKCRQHL